MSMAFLDTAGGSDTGQSYVPSAPSRYLTGFRYEGAGQNRVRYDQYSDGTEEGPIPDATTEATTTGGSGSSGATGGGAATKTAISTEQFTRGGRNILRTTYSDGTFKDEDLGSATTQADADAAFRAGQQAQQRTDAFSRLRALLNRVGLTELEGAVQGVITGGTVDLNDPNAIVFALRDQPAYQRRFAANTARAKKGLPELDPSTYVGLEEQYRQLMQSNGLPTGFYDQQEDFQKLIEGDVSPQELQSRIQQGYRRVRDADPEVRRQMRELYGVDDNALTAYFLDPERAQPLLERQARAAEIAARGREQAFMQLTATQAEELAARGDRKSTRLNSSHVSESRMPSSA